MDRVLLVGIQKSDETRAQIEDYLDELKMLAFNVDLDGAFRLIQRRDRPVNATYVGTGMVEKIGNLVQNEGLHAVLFDDELSPAQQRNLERMLPVPVYDRTFIILSIFSQRAKTKEARTQVALAQLKYEYPRLKRMWTHLHRQAGRIGGRGGEGEKQLELDRRMARQKMDKLEKELEIFEKRRQTRNKQRRNLVNIALVGYTNVGKSTIMNRLTKAHVEADNRLFVTLDATSRLWPVDPVLKVILSDTVGFIRKLPHDLVASFRSTLSEVHDADLLFHVVDAAHPGRDELMSTVHEVIQTLLGEEVPMIHVFNKTDLLTNLELKTLKRQFPQAIFLSALNGAGLEQLRTQVLQRFEHRLDQRIYFLRNQDMGEFHHLREYGQVLQTRTHEEGLLIAFRAMKESLDAFERQFPQFFPSSSAAMEPLADASAHENVPQEDFPSPTLGK